MTNQASIIRFVEDNWLGGTRIGGGSFDAPSNSISGMLDFTKVAPAPRLFLSTSTGEPAPDPFAVY